LPDAIRRAISAPGLSVGEVVLVEQSRPELIWPVGIILSMGSNAVLSGAGGLSPSATTSTSVTASSSASGWEN
jgi:hypothetical protein